MAAHSSVLAWRIPGTGSLVGCCLWGRTESDTTEAMQQQQQQTKRKRRRNKNCKSIILKQSLDLPFSSCGSSPWGCRVGHYCATDTFTFPVEKSSESRISFTDLTAHLLSLNCSFWKEPSFLVPRYSNVEVPNDNDPILLVDQKKDLSFHFRQESL